MSNLGVTLTLPVPDIAEDLEDYDVLRIYRASSYSGTYTAINTVTLVNAQTAYSYQDLDGTKTDWYRFSKYHSTATDESDLSPPFPAMGQAVYSRKELRRRVAKEMELFGVPRTEYTFPGPSGVTTSAGTNTTVVASGYISTYTDTFDWLGWHLRMLEGSALGEERVVSSFNASTGEFTVTPPLSAASGSGNDFDLYGERPSARWNEWLEKARLDVWMPFRIAIAGALGQRSYPLPASIWSDSQIYGLSRQTGTELRKYVYTPGQGFEVIHEDGGTLSLYFQNTLAANSVWYLEGRRVPPAFIDDDDVVALSDPLLRLYICTAVQKVAQGIADANHGAQMDTAHWRDLAARYEDERRGLVRDIGAFNHQRLARRDAMVTTLGSRFSI